MRGAIFVEFVHAVNIEKSQYFNVIGKGLMCQAGFLSDRNPWWLYGINISGFVALIHQQLTSQLSPGRQKSMCSVAAQAVVVAASKLLLTGWEFLLMNLKY